MLERFPLSGNDQDNPHAWDYNLQQWVKFKIKKNSILLHKPRSYMFESHENNLQPEMHILILLLDH